MKKLSSLITALGYFLTAKIAFAQVGNINLGNTQSNFGINADTGVDKIITNAITIVFIVAAVLVLAMLIWGGIEWVLSGGDKEKVGNARKRIIASLIGLVIIALAYVILQVVGGIVGFNVLQNLTIPALDT